LWALSRELYAPDFARYVDALLADLPVSPQSDLAAQLKAAAAELVSAGATSTAS
jgi:hypothetical protein